MFLLSGAVTEDKAKGTIKKALGIEYLPDLNTSSAAEGPEYVPPPWGPSDLHDSSYGRGAPLVSPTPVNATPVTAAPVTASPTAPASNGVSSVDSELERALEQLRNGDLARARLEAQSALSLCGQSCAPAQAARAHLYMGVASGRGGSRGDMPSEFNEALRLDPTIVLDPTIADEATRRAFDGALRHPKAKPAATP